MGVRVSNNNHLEEVRNHYKGVDEKNRLKTGIGTGTHFSRSETCEEIFVLIANDHSQYAANEDCKSNKFNFISKSDHRPFKGSQSRNFNI